METSVRNGSSLLFCGETGSGKTSLLTSCLHESALHERVVIVEELEEIPMLGSLWSKLLCKTKSIHGDGEICMDLLFRECLRLRPDRMVFGELRGADFLCFLEAVASGHQGVLASFHASSKEQVGQRLRNARFNPKAL